MLTILLFFSIRIFAFSQENNLIKIKEIPGDYVSFSTDILENIYLLSQSNLLKKFDSNGDSISVFNEIKKYGKATLIDATNPVKILMYYKGFSTLAILDGILNLKGTIDLRKRNIFNAEALSLSYDGKIWLFDEVDNTLKKLDDQGNIVFKTADFRQIFGQSISPTKIFDQNKFVYLYDPLQGLYVFDYYGAYKNRIDIKGWKHLRIQGNVISGSDDKFLYFYNTTTLQQSKWLIPVSVQDYRQIFRNGNKLYLLNEIGLQVFTLR